MLEEELLTRWEDIRSLSAKLTTSYTRDKSPTTKQRGQGTRDCLKKDGKMLVRTKFFNSILVEGPGDPPYYLTGERVLKLYDGKFLYIVKEDHDGKTVTKQRPTPLQPQYIGGRGLLTILSLHDDLRRTPDEMIDGHSVYVFQGTAGGGLVKTRHYIDKDTGILRKKIEERDGDNSTFTFELSDIVINPEFSEDHFTFTPPEGVEIQDLTRPGAVPAPPSAGP